MMTKINPEIKTKYCEKNGRDSNRLCMFCNLAVYQSGFGLMGCNIEMMLEHPEDVPEFNKAN